MSKLESLKLARLNKQLETLLNDVEILKQTGDLSKLSKKSLESFGISDYRDFSQDLINDLDKLKSGGSLKELKTVIPNPDAFNNDISLMKARNQLIQDLSGKLKRQEVFERKKLPIQVLEAMEQRVPFARLKVDRAENYHKEMAKQLMEKEAQSVIQDASLNRDNSPWNVNINKKPIDFGVPVNSEIPKSNLNIPDNLLNISALVAPAITSMSQNPVDTLKSGYDKFQNFREETLSPGIDKFLDSVFMGNKPSPQRNLAKPLLNMATDPFNYIGGPASAVPTMLDLIPSK